MAVNDQRGLHAPGRGFSSADPERQREIPFTSAHGIALTERDPRASWARQLRSATGGWKPSRVEESSNEGGSGRYGR